MVVALRTASWVCELCEPAEFSRIARASHALRVRTTVRPASIHGTMAEVDIMQTTLDLPDSLYQKSKALAASRGATVEQLIVEALAKEVQGNLGSGTYGDREVELPVIRSRRPRTLDPSGFDFDDLLA